MVGGADNGVPSVNLTATLDGTATDTEPSWSSSFGNLQATDGDTYATWDGNDTSTVYANAAGGNSSVIIEIVSPVKQSVTWNKSTSGVQEFEDKINEWLTKFGKKTTWQFGGGIEVSGERCDFYNDGSRTGYKAKASGSVSASSPEINADFISIPLGWGVSLTPTAKIEPFSVNGSVSFSFNETQSDPWVNPVTGSVGVSSGGKAGIKLQWGPNVANVNGTGTGSISIDGKLNFDRENREIRIASGDIEIGKLTLSYSTNIQLLGGSWTFASGKHDVWDGEKLKIPGLPKTIYTIPE